jgi:hypothetical protein
MTSILPRLAALHVFLAEHPDLADDQLPVSWIHDDEGSTGLYALIENTPDGLTLLHRIAAAAAVEVEVSEPFRSVLHKDGPIVIHEIRAVVHGVPLKGQVTLPAAEQQDGAE